MKWKPTEKKRKRLQAQHAPVVAARNVGGEGLGELDGVERVERGRHVATRRLDGNVIVVSADQPKKKNRAHSSQKKKSVV